MEERQLEITVLISRDFVSRLLQSLIELPDDCGCLNEIGALSCRLLQDSHTPLQGPAVPALGADARTNAEECESSRPDRQQYSTPRKSREGDGNTCDDSCSDSEQ